MGGYAGKKNLSFDVYTPEFKMAAVVLCSGVSPFFAREMLEGLGGRSIFSLFW